MEVEGVLVAVMMEVQEEVDQEAVALMMGEAVVPEVGEAMDPEVGKHHLHEDWQGK